MTSPNTTPLTYNSWVSAVANLAVEDVSLMSGVMTGSSVPFNTALATALAYAEGRIERDLDLLALETSRSYPLVVGNPILQISPNDFVTLRTIEINGVPCLPVSKEFLQNCYGNGATPGQPAYFAMYGGDLATGGSTFSNIMLGPPPAQAYGATVTGTTRMPSLYSFAIYPTASTETTWISVNLPDILLQASMIPISEYQRQFGAASNDPQMPGIFEQSYQTLMSAARTEELRKRFSASAWSSTPTSVAATPTR